MYKVTAILPDLRNVLVQLIPKLIAANAASRDDLIQIVSELAGEVQEGLSLVATYIRGAAYLETKEEIGKHFFDAETKL